VLPLEELEKTGYGLAMSVQAVLVTTYLALNLLSWVNEGPALWILDIVALALLFRLRYY
jgi:hypothetical protein